MNRMEAKQYIQSKFNREVKKTFDGIRKEIKEGLKDSLDNDAKKQLKAYFREECRYAFRQLGVSIRQDYRAFLKKFTQKHELFYAKADKCFKKLSKESSLMVKAIRDSLKEFNESKESMEELFLSIYSNIKRNQFIYAYYPEEWNETFLEFKEKIKKENEEFESLMEEGEK